MIKAGHQLKHHYEQQDPDEDSPRSVMLNDRSSQLANLAARFAEAGRVDDEAVSELRSAAGSHLDDLQMAALSARQGGLHHQFVIENRRHRLLQAALLNTPVMPPSEEDRPLLERVANFEAQSHAERWTELMRLEPRLAELERDIASGRIVVPHRGPRERGARNETLDEQRRIQMRTFLERVRALVGPDAGGDDPLLKTEAADAEVRSRLRAVGGT